MSGLCENRTIFVLCTIVVKTKETIKKTKAIRLRGKIQILSTPKFPKSVGDFITVHKN